MLKPIDFIFAIRIDNLKKLPDAEIFDEKGGPLCKIIIDDGISLRSIVRNIPVVSINPSHDNENEVHITLNFPTEFSLFNIKTGENTITFQLHGCDAIAIQTHILENLIIRRAYPIIELIAEFFSNAPVNNNRFNRDKKVFLENKLPNILKVYDLQTLIKELDSLFFILNEPKMSNHENGIFEEILEDNDSIELRYNDTEKAHSIVITCSEFGPYWLAEYMSE